MRNLCVLSVLLFGLAFAGTASAASATITSGSVSAYWDSSLSGFQLNGPNTQLVGEFYNGPAAAGFTPGTRADLDGTVTSSTSNHPFQEVVNGTTYTSVWIKFEFTFTTQPMAIPPVVVDGAFATFSTPFTMTGQFSGYSDQGLTNQVFSISVQGSGVASSLTMRSFTSPPQWVGVHSGAQTYTFTDAIPSSWTSADVGVVGAAGISSFGAGTFFVAGAGADIWGTADSFQFVSQPLAGDGAIVARVNGEQKTSTYAKAGIMIRRSSDRSSAHVVLDVRPDGSVEFMTRAATGGATTFLATATVSGQAWLKLSRAGSTVTASVSADGSTWTPLGTATLPGSALAGLVVTSHDTTVLNQAFFDSVSVAGTAATGDGLPLSWSQTDVGAVGQAGSASESGGTFTVSGAGADIWGTADAFHYVYTAMNSDGGIDARVTSMDNTSPFAKAGVMLRDSLDPGATHVILDVKPDGAVEFMTRSSPNGSTTFIASVQTSFPVSLRLTRGYGTSTSVVVAYVLDASNNSWKQIGWTMVPLGPDTTTGLAVTSHDPRVLNTAVFDQVHVAKNLLVEGGFEGYTPPALGPPGWVSDNPLRKVVAVSDGAHPHNGYQYGLCSTTTFEDCGMYQEVTAPADGTYVMTAFASADRSGGYIGVNVNDASAQSAPVDVRSPGNYGSAPYSLRVTAHAGDRLRVWMYSPASPGYVAIDDVALVQDFSVP